jgi:outer membrane protein OmpA-like peptidoglycan-associated protein
LIVSREPDNLAGIGVNDYRTFMALCATFGGLVTIFVAAYRSRRSKQESGNGLLWIYGFVCVVTGILLARHQFVNPTGSLFQSELRLEIPAPAESTLTSQTSNSEGDFTTPSDSMDEPQPISVRYFGLKHAHGRFATVPTDCSNAEGNILTACSPAISFLPGTAELTSESRHGLRNFASAVRKMSSRARVEIAARMATAGTVSYQNALTQARAKVVRDFLVGEGVDTRKLGLGEPVPNVAQSVMPGSQIVFALRP